MDDNEKINAVLRLWDFERLDTEQMANVLRIPQDEVERCLHLGLEKRRREKERAARSET